ncbi:dis32 [Symbiodinium natans]|uniref:Dis32 protein n=1 Tax=Symbiodinium natans TaxID=878477 RepID=A0A812Q5J2_9DINO|nr:dis32 [Symbiodinium natans]
MAFGAASLLLPVLAIGVAACTEPSSKCVEEDAQLMQIRRTGGVGTELDYWQCDRMCRYVYGFFDRYIVGKEVVKHTSCVCTRGDAYLGNASFAETGYETLSQTGIPPPKGDFKYAVPYNTSHYWCGADGSYTDGPPIYSTRMVCAISSMTNASARPLTYASVDDVPHGHTVLHCGTCGACSSPYDQRIIYLTRNNITEQQTKCSARYVLSQLSPFRQKRQQIQDLKPGCTHELPLRTVWQNQHSGMAFDDTGISWPEPDGKPTCMDCQVDNILNDKVLCISSCYDKFLHPSGQPYDEDACLQCDEYTSGPWYIMCGGCNRRSSGIVGDITRNESWICPVGYCYGKGDRSAHFYRIKSHREVGSQCARRQQRLKEGAMVLERSSTSFQLDDDGRVVGLARESASSVSHHLVEELMVLANHVVAQKLVEASASVGEDASEAGVRQALLRRHENTETAVTQEVLEMLPKELHGHAPQTLKELLPWCSQQLPKETYEALCDGVLKGFKEAEYMVADDDAADQDVGHWALSLPSYMHFTSPIRRYADILVHRRLAFILEAKGGDKETQGSHSAFLDSLKEAVETCNAKKRDAQDAQMEEIQIVLSDYVQRCGGVEVDDAVLTRILVPRRPAEARANEEPKAEDEQPLSFRQRLTNRAAKEALEIYVPLAQCARSVSLEVLGLEAAEPLPAPGPSPGKAEVGPKKREPRHREVPSLRVRVRGTSEEILLEKLQRLSVRLTTPGAQDMEPGETSRHWTIRVPWAQHAATKPPSVSQDPPEPPAIPPPPPPQGAAWQ